MRSDAVSALRRTNQFTSPEESITLIAVHEADVALTDFALAVECAIFVVLIARKLAPSGYRKWLIALFGSISTGALFGGLAHAYFPDNQVVWVSTMLSVGVSALACWNLSAEVLGKEWRLFRIAMAAQFVVYATVVVIGWRAYKLVIADYLPAAVFLLFACVITKRRNPALGIVAIGLVMTFVAAGIQLMGVDAPGISHNALYHVVQGVALLVMFVGFVRQSQPQTQVVSGDRAIG